MTLLVPEASTSPNPRQALLSWGCRRDARTPDETLVGTWRPSSADLDAELPQLLDELRAVGYRVTHVIYNPRDWRVDSRRLVVSGDEIKLGAATAQGPTTIGLVDAATWLRWDLGVDISRLSSRV